MSSLQQQQQYFEGLKKGIHFGAEWNTLANAVKHLKTNIVKYEETLLDPLATRLGPQLDGLCRQMKIEYEELDDLMDNENGVNRETEFESILYNLTVFKIKFKSIKKMHNARLKKSKRDIKERKNKKLSSL